VTKFQSRGSKQTVQPIQSSTKNVPELASRLSDSDWLNIDMPSLLGRDDAPAIVPQLAPQQLFLAMQRTGREECVDLMPMLSDEQWIKVVDYDGWRGEALVPSEVFAWLNLYQSQSPESMSVRYRQLDECYQIALLQGLIQTYDEAEIETLPEQVRDNLYALPCNTLFYLINTADQELHQHIQNLINSALAQDIAYAYSLFAYVQALPPNEQQAQASQFRRARLEEDGFVPFGQSIEALMPIAPVAGVAGGVDMEATGKAVVAKPGPESLLVKLQNRLLQEDEEALGRVQHGLMSLANSLCAAVAIEPDNVLGLKLILSHVQALVSLALEMRSQGDQNAALAILSAEHPKTLFRQGLGYVEVIRADVVHTLENLKGVDIEQFRRLWKTKKFAAQLNWIDEKLLEKIGFTSCEMLKSLFNRFPMRAEPGKERIKFVPIASRYDLETLRYQMNECLKSLRSLV